jgi:hypothetical protein
MLQCQALGVASSTEAASSSSTERQLAACQNADSPPAESRTDSVPRGISLAAQGIR